MWQRFTKTLQEAIFFAQQEALQYGDRSVDTEHLLLGILRATDNTACQVLRRLGVMPERVESQLRPQLARRDEPQPNDLELAPRAKKAIDFAFNNSRLMRCEKIQTEHLLIGLIQEHEGMAGQTLNELRVTADAARTAIRQIEEGR